MLLVSSFPGVAKAQSSSADTESSPSATAAASETDREVPSKESRGEEAEDVRARLATLEARIVELEKEKSERVEAEKRSAEGDPAKTRFPESSAPQDRTELSDHVPNEKHQQSFRQDDVANPRPGNEPLDPSYVGFVPLFGTRTWARFGGYVKLDAIFDSKATADPNQFSTESIFVSGQEGYGQGPRFNLHGKQSRLSFELRAPTPLGALRIFYENDFFGPGTVDPVYRLRHLYGQAGNFTVGQTWSAFVNSDSFPETLDISGPGALATVRQPQLRYTFGLDRAHRQSWALSVEQPKSDFAVLGVGASTRSVAPDVASHYRIESEQSHLQLGGLLRALTADGTSSGTSTRVAWGASLSGVLGLWGKDHLKAGALFGDGIGRYVQDVGGAGAAVVDATTGKVNTLFAGGGFAAYTHFWIEKLRSEATYGYLKVETTPEQGNLALSETHYAQGNLVWLFSKHFTGGVEYLYGHKTTRDGSRGDDHRVQLSVQYDLIR